jgi:alkylation response protein AidB-like acyl-CoA dehydrogenase
MLQSGSAGEVKIPLGRDLPEIRDGVRAVCARFPLNYWLEIEEADAYPDEFVAAMTEGSWLATLIPEKYGGAGLSFRAAGVILEEIMESGANSGMIHAQMYTMGTVLRHGNDEQKQRYLPAIAEGRLRLQAFGITEPTSGSDTTSIRTRAVRDGDDYVVTGQKIWTSRARQSDLMLLLVRTTPRDQVQKKTDGMSVLLVDINESLGKGMTIRPLPAFINHQTNEVFFDNLRVPVKNLIGEEGKGFRYILSGLNAERILVAHSLIGSARWFIDTAVKYANERVVFGRPIGQNQGVQFPLAESYASLAAADLMVRKAASMFDAGLETGEDANLARLLSGEANWEAAEACFQTHGGFAASKEYHVERRWREARLGRIAPVSHNLVLAYIAQHVLGLPRSY